MTPEPRYTVKVPMYDTGIGREAGYADDAALVAAYNAERVALSPEVRAMLDELAANVNAAFINGSR